MDIKLFLLSLKGSEYSDNLHYMLRIQGFTQINDLIWKHKTENVECLFHTAVSIGDKCQYITRIDILEKGKSIDTLKTTQKEIQEITDKTTEMSEADKEKTTKIYINLAFLLTCSDYKFGEISLRTFCDVMNTVIYFFPEIGNLITSHCDLPDGFLFHPSIVLSRYKEDYINYISEFGCYEYIKLFKKCANIPLNESDKKSIKNGIRNIICHMRPNQIINVLDIIKLTDIFKNNMEISFILKDTSKIEHMIVVNDKTWEDRLTKVVSV